MVPAQVNAHAAGTPLGDAAEAAALEALFGHRRAPVLVSSTKGASGHLLGAAGALEAVFSVLALRDGVAPLTRNLEAPLAAPGIALLSANTPAALELVASNSFGFGGTNATLLFSRAPEDLVAGRPAVVSP